MAKLKVGAKVVREYSMVLKFKAQEGDIGAPKARDIKALLAGQLPAHVKLVVKEVKQPA